MAGSASAVFTDTDNQKQCLQKANVTALHVSLPPANPSCAAVFGVAQLSHFQGIRPRAWLSPALSAQTALSLWPVLKSTGNPSPPPEAEVLHRDTGCRSEPMACPVSAQVPGAGQGGGGPGQLYRARVSTRRRGRSGARQERPVPRPVPRGRAHGPEVRPGKSCGWGCPHTWPGPGCFPCCPKLCPIPGCSHLLLG